MKCLIIAVCSVFVSLNAFANTSYSEKESVYHTVSNLVLTKQKIVDNPKDFKQFFDSVASVANH